MFTYLPGGMYFLLTQALSYPKLHSARIHSFSAISLLATQNPTHLSQTGLNHTLLPNNAASL